MIDLFINETRIALSEGETIQLVKANTRIGDLSTRQGHFTNDFRVKASAELIDIFGFANRLESESSIPSTKQDAELWLNNSFSIARGFVQVVKFDAIANEFTLSFFSGLIPWAQAIGSANIRDVYLSDYDHEWSAASIAAAYNLTDGYTYPIIDYGRVTTESNNVSRITDWYPAVFYHTLIERIFEAIGWKVGGSFINEFAYKNKAIPFSQQDFLHPSGAEILPGNTITISNILPNISQITLIKDMCIAHGLVVTTDEATHTVNFDSFEYIASRTSEAVDWSEKIDLNRVRSIDFVEVLKNYGQSTYFQYNTTDDSDTEVLEYNANNQLAFGDGDLVVSNDFIPESTDLYQSPFTSTNIHYAYTGLPTPTFLANIPLKAGADENVNNPGYRVGYILYALQDEFGDNAGFQVYNSGSSGASTPLNIRIPWFYFAKPTISGDASSSAAINNIEDSLAYDIPDGYTGTGLLSRWYARLSRILNKPRYIEISVKLWDYEYVNLDFTLPVYIDAGNIQGYFFIDVVEFDGMIAKVGLIQII